MKDCRLVDLRDDPHLLAWYLRISECPEVQRVYAVPVPEAVPMPPVARG